MGMNCSKLTCLDLPETHDGTAMKHSEGRIFTTHTGSLPRPDGLVEVLAVVARGEPVDESALEHLTDASTLEVIRKQVEAGVDVINSGE